MSFGSLQPSSAFMAIGFGCLLTLTFAEPPLTAADGYHFGFRHGAVTGFGVACLGAALGLWVSPLVRRIRRRFRAPQSAVQQSASELPAAYKFRRAL
jgi:hypothetical protein